MAFYKTHFELDAPYFVLLDGNYIHAAVKTKFNVNEGISSLLDKASVQAVTTACVVSELRALGESTELAAVMAKRMHRIPCVHQNTGRPWSAHDCLAAAVVRASMNPRHRAGYAPGERGAAEAATLVKAPRRKPIILASQDAALRNEAGRYPGVPCMYLHNGVPMIESVSALSKSWVARTEATKGRIPVHERAAVAAAVRSITGESGLTMKPKLKKKKKGPSGPNPLSVKRSTRKGTATSASIANGKPRGQGQKKDATAVSGPAKTIRKGKLTKITSNGVRVRIHRQPRAAKRENRAEIDGGKQQPAE